MNIIIIVGIIFMLMILNIFFNEELVISETENRTLAKMPQFSWGALAKGEYFAGLDAYVSDNFYQREWFVGTNRRVNAILKHNLLLGRGGTEVLMYPTRGTSGIVMKNGGVFFLVKQRFDVVDRFVATVNRYSEKLDIPVNFVSAPTACEFSMETALSEFHTPQRQVSEYVVDRLDKSVNYVDGLSALLTCGQEQLYFNSDHHWTSLGAYYVYAEFMKSQGKTPADITQTPLESKGLFNGSFYNFTNDDRVRQIQDEMFVYKPKASYTTAYNWEHSEPLTQIESYFSKNHNDYKIFLGGDYGYTTIQTDNQGDCILIIKDSYANAFMQYMIDDYGKIIIIDPRYFQETIVETVQREKPNSLLFINNMETLSDENFLNNLNRILE